MKINPSFHTMIGEAIGRNLLVFSSQISSLFLCWMAGSLWVLLPHKLNQLSGLDLLAISFLTVIGVILSWTCMQWGWQKLRPDATTQQIVSPSNRMALTCDQLNACPVFISLGKRVLLGMMIFYLSYFWTLNFALSRLQARVPLDMPAQDCLLSGVVNDLPTVQSFVVKAWVNVERIECRQERSDNSYHHITRWRLINHKTIGLHWYFEQGQPPPQLLPGDRWQWHVRLKPNNFSVNFAGFDWVYWQLEHNIGAMATVKNKLKGAPLHWHNVKLSGRKWYEIGYQMHYLRHLIYLRITRLAFESQSRAFMRWAHVLCSLVMGQQNLVDAQTWQIFQGTNLAHLLSISGTHVVLFAIMVNGLLGWIWRRVTWNGVALAVYYPVQKVQLLGAGVLGLAYTWFTGAGIPSVRTITMIWVVVIAQLYGRHLSIRDTLATAGWLIILWNPLSLLNAGLWLSFTAVAILLIFFGYQQPEPLNFVSGRDLRIGEGEKKEIVPISDVDFNRDINQANNNKSYFVNFIKQKVLPLVGAQLLITTALFPIMQAIFHISPWVGPLANLLLAPILSSLVVPLGLLGSLLPDEVAMLLFKLASFLLDCLAFCASLMVSWEKQWSFQGRALSDSTVFYVVLQIWILVLLWGWRQRLLRKLSHRATRVLYGITGLSICILVGCYLWKSHQSDLMKMRVSFLDVGQGSSVIVQTRSHQLVYDTGPGRDLESNAGRFVLLPFLSKTGRRTIDVLMLSHFDNDHVGGTGGLWFLTDVKHWISSFPAERLSNHAAEQIPHQRCWQGQQWEWDGVQFEVMWPKRDHTMNLPDNDMSCVLRISTPRQEFWLVGDISAGVEAEIIKELKDYDDSKTVILLLAHHGSRSSSSAEWINRLNPEHVVIQTGRLNRFGHPHPDVLARVKALGRHIWRTDQIGAIDMQVDQNLVLEIRTADKYRNNWWYSQKER